MEREIQEFGLIIWRIIIAKGTNGKQIGNVICWNWEIKESKLKEIGRNRLIELGMHLNGSGNCDFTIIKWKTPRIWNQIGLP